MPHSSEKPLSGKLEPAHTFAGSLIELARNQPPPIPKEAEKEMKRLGAQMEEEMRKVPYPDPKEYDKFPVFINVTANAIRDRHDNAETDIKSASSYTKNKRPTQDVPHTFGGFPTLQSQLQTTRGSGFGRERQYIDDKTKNSLYEATKSFIEILPTQDETWAKHLISTGETIQQKFKLTLEQFQEYLVQEFVEIITR